MKVLKHLAEVALIAIAVVLLTYFGNQLRSLKVVEASSEALFQECLHKAHYYPEVAYMLSNDSIMDIHRFWGIDTIEYYDWEETANGLGIPVELLTQDMYMDYLQRDSSVKYTRNRY